MNKKLSENEIDLTEILLVIWKNKFKLILIIFISLIITTVAILNKGPVQTKYSYKTKIDTILKYDEAEYDRYNTYLKEFIFDKKKEFINEENKITKILEEEYASVPFFLIDKNSLLNLFLDKINENLFIKNIIIKSGFIEKNDFNDNEDYESSIKEFTSSINIFQTSDDKNKAPLWYIEFDTIDLKDAEKFLLTLEQEANNEVKIYLKENFNALTENFEAMKKYKIEDIEIKISNSSSADDILKLELEKKMLISDKKIERLKKIFRNTPVSNDKKFFAGKIKVASSTYKIINKQKGSATTKLIIAGIIGLIFGSFFVLIYDSVRNRARLK